MLAAHVRSAKEKNLFVVALIFSSLVWIAIAVSLVGLLYAPFIALGIVVGHAFFLARLTGNSVRLGSRQLPELYKRVQEAAGKLGLDRMPEVYVTSGSGVLNAFATKLFSRWFVVLNAEVIDACEQLDEGKLPGDPSAVDFIVGHELGHLVLGHLSWNWLLWPAKLIPLLGPAYSRACEYSADACGLAVVEDAETASRALAVLSTGGRQARKVSIEAIVEQRHETGGLIMALVELNSTHPFLSKRVAAMLRAKNAAIGPEIGRNPLSYVMAPFFGWAAGGAAASLLTIYAYVAIIGMLAAIAIPNFEKYQERAKASKLGLEKPAALDDDAFKRHDEPAADLENLFGKAPETGGLGVVQPQQLPDPIGGLKEAALDEQGTAGFVPTPPAPVETPKFEARTWLKGQIAGKNPEAIANFGTMPAAVLVDRLYKAGASKVWVSSVGVDDKGIFANDLVVDMPVKASARKKLVDLCSAEFKKQGVTEPCVDDPVSNQLWFNWQPH